MSSLRLSTALLSVALCLAGPIILWPASNCTAGAYLDSAHGDSSDGVQRTSMGAYATGNCAHCHEQHASVGGSEPSPNSPAGPDVYLEAANEEELCFACHGTTPVGTAPDIETDVTTNTYGHLSQNYSGIHRTNETLGNTTKHIECTDCHNPHAAGNTLHTPGSETAATVLTSASPLYGVTGADPDYATNAPNIWTAPAQEDYTLQTATKEYQICFKCHSGAVGNPATWSSTSGSTAWTDVGLEFSPYNKSGHPVVTGLNNYPNSDSVTIWPGPIIYKGLNNYPDTDPYADWDQLLDTWGTNTSTQTMYCSDCHTTDSNGPHGSSIKWTLKGPNQAWPYNTAAENGGSTGDFKLLGYQSPSYYPLDSNLSQLDMKGTPDAIFCWNCHPTGIRDNKVHMQGFHQDNPCVDCHIRVPHGGKVSRLIAAANYDTYGESDLPDRYTADGNGNNSIGTKEPIVRKFQKALFWSYGGSSCYAPMAACASYHGTESTGDSW